MTDPGTVIIIITLCLCIYSYAMAKLAITKQAAFLAPKEQSHVQN